MERRSALYDISGVTRDKSMHLKAENWFLSFPDAKNLIFTCVDPFPTMGAHLATLSGNMSVVNQFIASDFQVDTRDSYGNTMLHYAAVSDNAKMEKLITETFGANPTLVNNAMQTPADVKKTRRLCMIQHASFVPPFGGAYLPCQPMSTEEITRSLLDIDNRNAARAEQELYLETRAGEARKSTRGRRASSRMHQDRPTDRDEDIRIGARYV